MGLNSSEEMEICGPSMRCIVFVIFDILCDVWRFSGQQVRTSSAILPDDGRPLPC